VRIFFKEILFLILISKILFLILISKISTNEKIRINHWIVLLFRTVGEVHSNYIPLLINNLLSQAKGKNVFIIIIIYYYYLS
jgi:hypothetical protein